MLRDAGYGEGAVRRMLAAADPARDELTWIRGAVAAREACVRAVDGLTFGASLATAAETLGRIDLLRFLPSDILAAKRDQEAA